MNHRDNTNQKHDQMEALTERVQDHEPDFWRDFGKKEAEGTISEVRPDWLLDAIRVQVNQLEIQADYSGERYSWVHDLNRIQRLAKLASVLEQVVVAKREELIRELRDRDDEAPF